MKKKILECTVTVLNNKKIVIFGFDDDVTCIAIENCGSTLLWWILVLETVLDLFTIPHFNTMYLIGAIFDVTKLKKNN